MIISATLGLMKGYDRNDSAAGDLRSPEAAMSKWTRALLALLAVSAVFVARSLPTSFPSVPTEKCVQGAHASHDQRPRFDNEDSNWSVPVTSSVQAPLPTIAAIVTAGVSPEVQWIAKGAHCTRPPPMA